MTPLDRTLIEKAGHENGWENAADNADAIELSSARHHAKATVRKQPNIAEWRIQIPGGLFREELLRALPAAKTDEVTREVIATSRAILEKVLRCAAELAIALPNQPSETYNQRLKKALATPPSTTEVERLVKQRVGQDVYREALMAYWHGACAVTGVTVPDVLRASHAKPWADCLTDDERLDVFNGLLLCAHLDALFDRGLITFADDGALLRSPCLTDAQAALLHISPDLRLRHIAPAHRPYLDYHRNRVFSK